MKGFVEGCLDRIAEDEPEEADFARNLWEGGDEEDRASVLEMLKEECEVREGRFDDRPNFSCEDYVEISARITGGRTLPSVVTILLRKHKW